MNRNEIARNEQQESRTRANGTGVWLLYCLTSGLLWLGLIVAKILGRVTWGWPVVLLSYVGISIAVMAAFLLLAAAMIAFGRGTTRFNEWKRRRKIAWALWESMEGLTLNSVGPVYGVRRQPGEKNKSYKRRILKAARTLDVVNVQNVPKPATGQKLDDIAGRHGLTRRKNETDEQLQGRIREAVLKKLEGGGTNGV